MNTPWIDFMGRNLGEKEIAGPRDNPFIIALFKHTNYGKPNHDETPWCAACACAALEESGFSSPHSASAKSFLNYGDPCELKPGAIVVIRHIGGSLDGHYHVAFLDHVIDADWVCLLGGNQADSISAKTFRRNEIVAVRWPTPKEKAKDEVVKPKDPAPSMPAAPRLAWANISGSDAWTAKLIDCVNKSRLPDLIPANVQLFSPNYKTNSRNARVQFWSQLFSIMAKFESSFNPHSIFHEPPPLGVDSIGLFQLSYEDESHYHLPMKLDRAKRSLEDPLVNIEMAVFIAEQLVSKSGMFCGRDANQKWRGLSAYWSVMRNTKNDLPRPSFVSINAYMREHSV